MRTTAKAFSFFLVGALAFIALLTPTTVEAQEELDPGVVTITVTSSDPGTASVMPAGSTWMVSDGVNTISDVFADGDLALPSTIVTDNPIPGGTYTVTVNAGPDFQLFSDAYTVDGDTSITAPLTPVPPAPDPDPEPVMAPVSASAWACTDLGAPGLLSDVGDDCVPTSASFTFYLVGDDSGIANYSLDVDGSGSTNVEVGSYEVFASNGTTFDLTVPEAGANFAYGYPAAPAPDPEPEIATLNVSAYECEGVTGAPIVLGEIGDDCTPISTTLSFYLWGDGTDDVWQVTTSTTDAVALNLPVGGYDVVNEATQETVGVQVPAGTSSVAFGFGSGAPAPDPDPEMATLAVTAYACDGIEGNPIVLEEIGPDCVQISTTLSFYLWGDSTDDYWQVTTNSTDPVSFNLPVGGYEVVNEASQQTVGVQVPSGSSEVAFGFPTTVQPPADQPPADQPPAQQPPVSQAPVSKLPSTGTGTENSVNALAVIASGAILAAGALGVRIRKA